MATQLGVAVRDAQNNAIPATVGTAPILEIRSGSPPANCAAADTGTLLVSMSLPSSWLGASSGGVMSKLGTWTDASADAGGTAGHFRIWNTAR